MRSLPVSFAVQPQPMFARISVNSVGPVGPVGTLSPSIQDSVGTLSPSIQDYASVGTPSPSIQDYAGPEGPVGTLSPSIQDYASFGTLSPSIQDYAGLVGPFGTLSPSIQDYAGPVLAQWARLGRCPCLFRTMLAQWARLGRCPCLFRTMLARWARLGRCPHLFRTLLARRARMGRFRGCLPVIETGVPATEDPVLPRLSADGPSVDSRDIVKITITMDISPVAPDGGDGRPVVAMIGLHTDLERIQDLMDCGDDGMVWDIRDEFQTVDYVLVCYDGDSEDSEWEDPWRLVYVEHVDPCAFDALDGMKLEVRQRLRADHELVIMVVSATALDTFPDGHDVSAVADSPVSRIRGVDLYCDDDSSDLSVSDCESVEERNTWNDWCDSAFRTGSDGFPPGDGDTQPVVVFSNRLWWDDTMAESLYIPPDDGCSPVWNSPILAETIMPSMLADTVRLVRWDGRGLALLDSWIGEVSVLEEDVLATCSRDVQILNDDEGWLCLLCFPRSGHSGDTSVASGVYHRDLGHCGKDLWDPGPVGEQCLPVCGNCLHVIALFCDMMSLIHDWTVLSACIGVEIGCGWTYAWDVACFGDTYPPGDVDHLPGWREAARTGGVDDGWSE